MQEKEIRKSLRSSVYDGAAFAVVDGMTTSFITPFAVALNASIHLIAALAYLPQLAAGFIQLFAAKLVEEFIDRRKILVVGSVLQSFLWIPMLLIPYASPNQKFLIVVYMTLQTIISNLMNPVWNSLMGDIVPVLERGRFFGLRNKIVGLISFFSAIAAGLILNYTSPHHTFLGFTILFSTAFAARLLTATFRGMISNPKADIEHQEKFSLFDFVRRMDKTNYGHFVMYMSFFKFAVNIASPFFAVYMLKELNFTYLQFTFITAVELIASFISFGFWGRLIDERGTKSVLFATGFLTPLIPFLWLFSSNFNYLIFIEVISGISWAGFNLSSSNFIFDAVKPENRVRCTAYFKFFESMSLFFGALLGGFLIERMPLWLFSSSFLFVFLISGILRLLASVLVLPSFKEARLIEMGIGHSFFKKYLSIRPQEGIVFEVIGKYHKLSEKIVHTKNLFLKKDDKKPEKKEDYNKKLLKFIGRNISSEKEKRSPTEIHEVEDITEDIKKGRLKK